MKQTDLQIFKPDFEEFKEKTRAFYAGEMDKGAYKSFPVITAAMPRKAARPICCVCACLPG